MARVILDERKRREIDPTLVTLRECVTELKAAGPEEAVTRDRLLEMLAFLDTLTSLYEEIHRMPTGAVRGVLRAKGKVTKLLRGKRSG